MEPNDIRTLKLLEKVDEKHPQSQRALARELNISVGLVNSFIKRLAKKGYIKIVTSPKNRVRYIVTPTGLSEKSRLTYNFIQLSYSFYVQARKKLNILFNELENLNVRHIVFFGATDLAEMAYLSLHDSSIELSAIVDDRDIRKMIVGQAVKPIAQLDRISYERILITDDRGREEIQQKILPYSIPQQKIIWLE
ncbi:MAG: winged helix-turn-helix transcriptional regulator [Desulfobacterales bacterium]|nr:winged helix-turn-helix transcriptional regulator [Desulfobacterales bacterium]